MALSRSARITLLLVIDIVFFFVELILTASSPADSRYSYGWHRAEILAALINGVFLLALCFSISLEAIERFFSTPESITGISSPQKPLHVPVRSRSPSQSEFSSLYGHPIATRASVVQQAQEIALARSPSPTTHRHSISRPSLDSDTVSHIRSAAVADDLSSAPHSTERSPLLQRNHESELVRDHGHSHGSMNMRALVLHVMGDALGNVGVILTGLIIWRTQWTFKYYFDPIISLVITVIIFSSALPLVRSASFILLQGVPSTISLDGVRDSILEVDGVLSVHELHVWQLSESKIIASVHVLASRDHDFMPIAVKIRRALHHHGIHSSTIQPEYPCPGIDTPNGQFKGETSCLIPCPSDQACDPLENACCPPSVVDV
ncbi:hypothetical protein H0H93_011796 [Arthromyces matolae]|nr:hypothetical protein H0H93_011796 [Arthromyces matolae]